jgi:hypothetical protein
MVVVHHAQRPDPGGGEIEQRRAPQPASSDHKHPRRAQPLLPRPADLAQHDMPRIPRDLLRCEGHPGSPLLPCFAIRAGVKARAATALARLGLDAGVNRSPTMDEAP